MTIYLTNAFSLNMLRFDAVTLRINKIPVEAVKEMLKMGYTSAIGHEGTAQLLTQILQMDISVNRIPIKLYTHDVAIVFQLQTRLPEGTILTSDQLKDLSYAFYEVRLI